MNHSPHHPDTAQRPSFLKSPVGVALAMVAVIAAFFVLREHWAHVLGNLPYVLLLACPLMHLFGHGHGRHGGHRHGGDQSDARKPDKQG